MLVKQPSATPSVTAKLLVSVVGIVYGDIGTSPLYTMKSAFEGNPDYLNTPGILGVCSLILWSMFLIVTIKYVTFILKADHHGEGGVLALSTLLARTKKLQRKSFYPAIAGLGLVASCLFFGDGVLTPAISVLGALEGIRVVSPQWSFAVVPLTMTLIAVLFLMQSRGTRFIGMLFGPVMVLWFSSIGVLGLLSILKQPLVLSAFNPLYAVAFLSSHGVGSFVILGAVFLAVTGAEALYADLGHFNRDSIRKAWLYFVFPCLTLNYLGQGALLLENPAAISNPFYNLVPSWGLYPMIVLATAATVIASQSIISGIFSVGAQLVRLDYLPLMRINYTSSVYGQVYIPVINYLMMFVTLGTVLSFGSTTKLAYAYGITISCIMLITSMLLLLLARYKWQWSATQLLLFFVPVFIIELSFWGINMTKLLNGGWFPILIALLVFMIISTWKKGRRVLLEMYPFRKVPLAWTIRHLLPQASLRVPGTAVYFCRVAHIAPNTLLNQLEHFRVAHENILFLNINTQGIPRVKEQDRFRIKYMAPGVFQVIANYGFNEVPNVSAIISNLSRTTGIPIDPEKSSFFVGRSVLISSPAKYLAGWREWLFMVLHLTAMNPTDFYGIPHERVIDIGTRHPI